MKSKEEIKNSLPPELELIDDIYDKNLKKFTDNLPLATRKGNCTCSDIFCPHKAEISPLFMVLMGNLTKGAIRYKGSLCRDFRPYKYELWDIDFLILGGLIYKLDKDGKVIKTPSLYDRFGFSEEQSKDFVCSPIIEGKSVTITPRRMIDVFEGFVFTGKCKPLKAYIVTGTDKPAEISLKWLSSGRFYIPLKTLCYSSIAFKFEFEDFKESDFKYRVIAGNFNFIDIAEYRFCIPINNTQNFLVINNIGCVIERAKIAHV
jgi:hypothetical protein